MKKVTFCDPKKEAFWINAYAHTYMHGSEAQMGHRKKQILINFKP